MSNAGWRAFMRAHPTWHATGCKAAAAVLLGGAATVAVHVASLSPRPAVHAQAPAGVPIPASSPAIILSPPAPELWAVAPMYLPVDVEIPAEHRHHHHHHRRVVETPEPAGIAVLGVGLLGLFAARRRRA